MFGQPATGSGLFASPQSNVFGAPTTTQTFSFNTGQPNIFGSLASTATTQAFGTTNTFANANTGFGNTSTFPQFNSTFSSNQPSTNLFNQQQQHQQTQQQTAVQTNLSIFQPSIFGDERDNLIGRFNMLMCAWGVGRAYYNSQGQYMDFKPDNLFSMFKAVGYSRIPCSKNEDGLVRLTFQRCESDIHSNQQMIIDRIAQVFGTNRPNISISVHTIKAVDDQKCDFTFFVQEKQASGGMTTVGANNLLAFLQRNKPQFPPQLVVTEMALHVAMPTEVVNAYLNSAPSGINPVIWEQALIDNPDSSRYLPVAILGFNDLSTRVKQQLHEVESQQKRITLMTDDLQLMERRLQELSAKYEDKAKSQLQLAHRLLKIMVFLEVKRKSGQSLMSEEEMFADQLENIQHQFNMPSQFKGRLNELMSQFRMQNSRTLNGHPTTAYKLEETAKVELLQMLANQQEAFGVLKKIMSEGSRNLNIIKTDLESTFNSTK